MSKESAAFKQSFVKRKLLELGNWRISRLDEYNFIIDELSQVNKKDGKWALEWLRRGYHSTFYSALKALRVMVASEGQGYEEIKTLIDKFDRRIAETITDDL